MKRPSHEALSCTFCAKTAAEVEKLIAGPAVFICGACVEAAELVVRPEGTQSAPPKTTGRDCSFCGRRLGVFTRATGLCRETLAEARPNCHDLNRQILHRRASASDVGPVC